MEIAGGASGVEACVVRIPADEAGLAPWVMAVSGLGLAAQVCGHEFPAGRLEELAGYGIDFAGVKEDATVKAWADVYDAAHMVAIEARRAAAVVAPDVD